MPPKTKIHKELIVSTAYEMTKMNGIDSVTAKAIAKQLNCSIQPVYWVFENMDNLRKAIMQEAIKEYDNYLFAEIPNLSKYQAAGWNYIRFAREQPHLFTLLFMTERQRDTPIAESDLDKNKEYLISLIKNDYVLSDKAANDLYVRLWLFSHGVATMIVTKTVSLNDKEIRKMIMDVLNGLLQVIKKENNL